MTEDFTETKVGDMVALTRGFGNRLTLHHVIKLTPKQVVIGSLGNGSQWRFWRDGGREVGNHDSYSTARIRPITDAVRQKMKREQALDMVQSTNWERLETSVLIGIVGLIKNPPRHSESAMSADAVDPQVASTGTPTTRAKGSSDVD